MSLIYGKQTTNEITPVLVDASGHIIIDGASPSLFRPVSKITGFINLTLPAGASDQVIATVPAGETWRMTTFSYLYIGTVVGLQMNANVYDGTNIFYFDAQNPVVNGKVYVVTINAVLPAGYKVRVSLAGATLNDDLYGNVFAERIY